MAEELTQDYWDERWQNAQTGWDIGEVAPIMREYIDQIPDRDASILIPGSGSAHEAAYLLDQGFTQVSVIDISPTAAELARERFADTTVQVFCEDFFEHDGQYDFILEQTFFCALPPSMRPDYVTKTHSLLSEGGILFGLMFDREFDTAGPPFGGTVAEYQQLFDPVYSSVKIEPSRASIAPRQGTEVFVEMQK